MPATITDETVEWFERQFGRIDLPDNWPDSGFQSTDKAVALVPESATSLGQIDLTDLDTHPDTVVATQSEDGVSLLEIHGDNSQPHYYKSEYLDPICEWVGRDPVNCIQTTFEHGCSYLCKIDVPDSDWQIVVAPFFN